MVPEVCHILEHKDSTPLFEMPDGAVILHRDCYVTEIERERRLQLPQTLQVVLC